MLKKLIKFNWDDFALLGGAAAGMFLLAQIVTALVLLFFRDGMGHVVLLSGVILPAVMGFVLLFTSLGHFMLTFDLGVRFSLTRRRSLGLTAGVAGLQALFAMAAAGLLARLEEALMPRAWKVLSGAQALDISVLGREPGGAARAPEPGAARPPPPPKPPPGGPYLGCGGGLVNGQAPGGQGPGPGAGGPALPLRAERNVDPVGNLDGGVLSPPAAHLERLLEQQPRPLPPAAPPGCAVFPGRTGLVGVADAPRRREGLGGEFPCEAVCDAAPP